MEPKPAIPSISVIIGLALGFLFGTITGANLVWYRNHEDLVPRAEFRRICDEEETITTLYFAERKLNVDLMHQHRVAKRILPRHPQAPAVVRGSAAQE